jgi:hypothetical protein
MNKRFDSQGSWFVFVSVFPERNDGYPLFDNPFEKNPGRPRKWDE